MKKLILKSFGKINLGLDVIRKLEDGYHEVEMVMQQIELHDIVSVKFYEGDGYLDININTDKYYIPKDERNIGYKAAKLIWEKFGKDKRGKVKIDIKKNIPVSAGLAGGSGNAGAVLLALNELWNINLNLRDLADMGSELGSDVPFSIFNMAYSNKNLQINKSKEAMSCALAKGKGTILERLTPLDAYVVLSKPNVSVSTKEVYQSLKLSEIKEHPKIKNITQGLVEKDFEKIKNNMANILEIYTLKGYDKAMYTKNKMQEACGREGVLMSGSGPTIYAILKEKNQAEKIYTKMKKINKQTFLTRTIV